MKKSILIFVILICSLRGAAIAEEWNTAEALRAFGKPGDTVKGSSDRASTTNKSYKGHKKTAKRVFGKLWLGMSVDELLQYYPRALEVVAGSCKEERCNGSIDDSDIKIIGTVGFSSINFAFNSDELYNIIGSTVDANYDKLRADITKRFGKPNSSYKTKDDKTKKTTYWLSWGNNDFGIKLARTLGGNFVWLSVENHNVLHRQTKSEALNSESSGGGFVILGQNDNPREVEQAASSPSSTHGDKDEVWQQCKMRYLNKLENPGSAIFPDDPMRMETIKPNGSFYLTTEIYAKSGGSLKRFLFACKGNTADYSSIEIH